MVGVKFVAGLDVAADVPRFCEVFELLLLEIVECTAEVPDFCDELLGLGRGALVPCFLLLLDEILLFFDFVAIGTLLNTSSTL